MISYHKLRRRNNGRFIVRNYKGRKVNLDNRWVVPYNPLSTMVYNAHINTEICSSVTAVKYLYKYVYKGHDKAVISFVNDGELQQKKSRDEINLFLDSRYITASEGLWRIYHYNMHSQYPSVIRLPIHLENNQKSVYDPTKISNDGYIEEKAKTLLTEYFICNSLYPEAKKHLYHELPKHFVWKADSKTWKPRKRY